MEHYFQFYDVNWENPEQPTWMFMKDLWPFLRDLVEDQKYGRFFIEERMRDAREAFYDFGISFETTMRKLSVSGVEGLIENGLVGVQARYKFGNVTYWIKQFIISPIARNLECLLDSIDVVLDSILNAIGAGHAIKEFKDGLKNIIVHG